MLADLAQALAARPDLLAQIGALLAGVVLVAILARTRGWTPGLRASVAQDGAYLVERALVTLPLSLLLLAALDRVVDAWAPGVRIGWLPSLPWWAQLVSYFVLMDAVAYATHRAFHAVPWLWRFHAIHHSQRELNAFTTVRTHALEILVKRVVAWAPLVILGEPAYAFAGLVFVDGLWGFFVHSNLRVPLGPLRYVFVEPSYHLLHHSTRPEHHHANFAERLVLWDVVTGRARFERIRDVPTGIDDASFPRETEAGFATTARTWLAQFLHPFRRLGRSGA